LPTLLTASLLAGAFAMWSRCGSFWTWHEMHEERSVDFSSKDWKAAEGESGVGLRMIDSLIGSVLRAGIRKADVIDLLGRPGLGDVQPCFSSPPPGTSESLCFYIGHSESDPCTLLVSFGRDERFIRAQVNCN